MNCSLETNYQQDILQVKKIWKDIKDCEKGKSNIEKSKKNKNGSIGCKITSPQGKKTVYSKIVKGVNSADNNKNSRKTQEAQTCEVFQFCTKNTPLQKNPYEKQLFMNQKSNIVKENVILTQQKPAFNEVNLHQQIHQLNKEVERKDYKLSLLRTTNQRNTDIISQLKRQIEEKESCILKLKNRENQLLGETCKLNSKQLNFEYGQVEYQNFRNDSRRLLKMLQATQEYETFASLALKDDGVRFLGKINKNRKSKVDFQMKEEQKTSHIHFCTCNKAFLPQSGFWVPQKAYDFGKQFIKQRNGEVTDAELQLLLYELNKIWRQRQKRIMNSANSLKALEVGKYKRKLQLLGRKDSTGTLDIDQLE